MSTLKQVNNECDLENGNMPCENGKALQPQCSWIKRKRKAQLGSRIFNRYSLVFSKLAETSRAVSSLAIAELWLIMGDANECTDDTIVFSTHTPLSIKNPLC